MLGERLGEEHGKVTSRRVLEGSDYRYVKMEVGFEAAARPGGSRPASSRPRGGTLSGCRP